MTKEENFAKRMSELLFTMRSEDSFMTELQDEEGREIPEEYIDKVLEDDKHCTAIKEKIRLSVLESVTKNSRQYKVDNDGEFQYTAPDTYDHSYIVDTYIEEQFLKDYPIMANRHVCSICGSDNVQIRAWVRPNQNNKFIDEVKGDEMDWCDDCDLTTVVETKNMNVRSNVIGFQVDLDADDEMHPDMDASFCVYSLPQVQKMIAKDKNRWNLLTIYDDTIEKPTMMFNGDCREPDETVMEAIIKSKF